MTSTVTENHLTLEQVERFRQDGYLGPFVLSDSQSELADFRERIEREVLPTKSAWSGTYNQGRHLDCAVIYELCSHPAVIGRVAGIFGSDLLLWQSNLFVKAPGDREFPWHQDANYWPIEPQLNLSAWIAIDDATPENGCVQVIPGSHKKIVPHRPSTDPRYDPRFGGQMADPDAIDSAKAVSIPLKAGEFFLFNERTLHHSDPNRSKSRRVGLTTRVTIPLVKVYGKQPVILVSGEDRLGFNSLAQPPRD